MKTYIFFVVLLHLIGGIAYSFEEDKKQSTAFAIIISFTIAFIGIHLLLTN